jgi:hypothetical protein
LNKKRSRSDIKAKTEAKTEAKARVIINDS